MQQRNHIYSNKAISGEKPHGPDTPRETDAPHGPGIHREFATLPGTHRESTALSAALSPGRKSVGDI